MQFVDKTMKSIFSNKYYSAIITLIIVLYGALAGPKLPKFVTKLFNNMIFRVVFLTLIVYKGNKDLTTSISIAVGFLITVQILGEQKFLENFTTKGVKTSGDITIEDTQQETSGDDNSDQDGMSSDGDFAISGQQQETNDSDNNEQDGMSNDFDVTSGGQQQGTKDFDNSDQGGMSSDGDFNFGGQQQGPNDSDNSDQGEMNSDGDFTFGGKQ